MGRGVKAILASAAVGSIVTAKFHKSELAISYAASGSEVPVSCRTTLAVEVFIANLQFGWCIDWANFWFAITFVAFVLGPIRHKLRHRNWCCIGLKSAVTVANCSASISESDRLESVASLIIQIGLCHDNRAYITLDTRAHRTWMNGNVLLHYLKHRLLDWTPVSCHQLVTGLVFDW